MMISLLISLIDSNEARIQLTSIDNIHESYNPLPELNPYPVSTVFGGIFYTIKNDKTIHKDLIKNKVYDPATTYFLLDNHEKFSSTKIVDLGGSCGYLTTIFSDIVGSNGTVDNFEPTNELAVLTSLNRNLNLDNVANTMVVSQFFDQSTTSNVLLKYYFDYPTEVAKKDIAPNLKSEFTIIKPSEVTTLDIQFATVDKSTTVCDSSSIISCPGSSSLAACSVTIPSCSKAAPCIATNNTIKTYCETTGTGTSSYNDCAPCPNPLPTSAVKCDATLYCQNGTINKCYVFSTMVKYKYCASPIYKISLINIDYNGAEGDVVKGGVQFFNVYSDATITDNAQITILSPWYNNETYYNFIKTLVDDKGYEVLKLTNSNPKSYSYDLTKVSLDDLHSTKYIKNIVIAPKNHYDQGHHDITITPRSNLDDDNNLHLLETEMDQQNIAQNYEL